VIYEIYPRSFADTNGDGIGDLKGIIGHLDYLADLGVDAIWIAPFYPSPQVDFGYDVSDYTGIEPAYGTIADFDRLVSEASKRHIRIIADLVLNHSSDQHAWFQESRTSQTNPRSDWYMWRDGKPGGQPPTNWQSVFGHSAWTQEMSRDQFYYHKFYPQQPDLNWRNPDVRAAMYDAARFWMGRGVAGFRLDAIGTLFEDAQFRDEPLTGGVNAFGDPNLSGEYTAELPEVHDVLRELRQVTNAFPGRVLIGETGGGIAAIANYYGKNGDEIQLPMDFDYGFINELSADRFRQALRDAETQLNGNVPLFVFDNHDNRRSWDRYADGLHDDAIARLIATLLLTPRCSALLYYGQEIGMRNNDPKSIDQALDPVGKVGWPNEIGRDGERTPMQWSAGRNAGFSDGSRTWLPVGPEVDARNVEGESSDPASLLNYYKALIHLRKKNEALNHGDLTLIDETNSNVLSFLRRAGRSTVLVALNVSPIQQTVQLTGTVTTLLASFDVGSSSLTQLVLPAFGAYVGEVDSVMRTIVTSSSFPSPAN
jgi:alpha-glucosidase